MPVTEVQTPSGDLVQVEHPEGASPEKIIEFAAASQGVTKKTQLMAVPNVQPSAMVSPMAAEVQMEDISAYKRFMYEFGKAPTITGNLMELNEPLMPIGYFNIGGKYGFYASPSEIFGEEYDSMTVDQRKARLKEFHKEAEQIKYPQLSKLVEQGESTGIAGVAGAFLGALADPTTLLPVGSTIKGAAAISGLLGAAYEATTGLVEEGEIDLMRTAGAAALGGGLGAGVTAAITKGAPAYNRLRLGMNKAKTAKSSEAANKNVDALNNKIMELQAEGFVDEQNLLIAAGQRMDMSPAQVVETIKNKTTPFIIPEPEVSVALNEFQNAVKSSRWTGIAADILEPISDRMGAISPPVLRRFRTYEMDLLQRTKDYGDRIEGFDLIEKALPDQGKEEFADALLNLQANPNAPREILAKYNVNKIKTKIVGGRERSGDEIIDDSLSLLEEIGSEWSNLNNGKVTLRKNFFPRENMNVAETRRYYGLTNDPTIDKMLDIKAESLGLSGRNELPELASSKVWEDFVAGTRYESKNGKINVRRFKGRKIDAVPKELIKNYRQSSQTLHAYVNEMADNIETLRLMKKQGSDVIDEITGGLDTKKSIGALVDKLHRNGEISSGQADDLAGLMQARLVAGKTSMSEGAQIFRNLTNAALLGNIRSATTQVGDLFMGAYRYGGLNQLNAMLKTITGRSDIKVDDIGLLHTVSAEMSGAGKTAKFLDTVLFASMFKGIDRFGKNSSMQAAFERNVKLAKSPKGVAKLKDKWGDYFGEDFDALTRDLASRNVTGDVKALALAEISGIQPVTMLETPKAYLNAKDGRLFYMLKMYGLRQLATVRNDTVKEWQKGNQLQAVRNGIAFATIVGLGNAGVKEVKNWEDGKGFDPKRVPDQWWDSILNVAMMSRYAVENNLREGDVVGLALDAVTPPIGVIQKASKDFLKVNQAIIEGKDVGLKWTRNIPFLGRAFYNLFGGGAEEFLEREAKERAKD